VALTEELAGARGDRADVGAERRQLAAAIQAAVAALPDTQRAVFVLREYHDLDYSEIAAALELDLGTVKSRLARARGALRARLEAALPELKERS
jgi:RNA polymerase sigma-70 factor (ECF subfamily)